MFPLEKSLPPEEVHARVRAAHRLRRTGDRALAFYLREVCERRLWEGEGFADIFHYARVVADLSVKTTRDLLRVAERLEELPQLAQGYASGEIPWSKVRELSRIATPQQEEAWIEAASALSCRAVEDLVARGERGDSPEGARRRRANEGLGRESVPFVLYLRPEVHALLTRAIEACRRRENGRSVEEAVVAFAETALRNEEAEPVSSDPESRPSLQLVLCRCEVCGSSRVEPGNLPAPAALVDRAGCDAEVVDVVSGARASRTIPPRVRRAVMLRDKGKCQVPGCTYRLWTDCHHVRWRSKGGGNDPENLVVLCTRHHTAVHEGRLIVEPLEGGGWQWRQGDGRAFGGVSHVGNSRDAEREALLAEIEAAAAAAATTMM